LLRKCGKLLHHYEKREILFDGIKAEPGAYPGTQDLAPGNNAGEGLIAYIRRFYGTSTEKCTTGDYKQKSTVHAPDAVNLLAQQT
jgi:hypothetical protein